MSNHRVYCLLLLVQLAIFGLVNAVRAAPEEIWIIEHPDQLNIYSRYEQRLNQIEKSGLKTNGPWRILDKRFLLSDQFTQTIKTEFEQNIYYFQIDEKGDLVNRASAGLIEKINTNKIWGDTIRIIAGEVFFWPPSGTSETLHAGTLLARFFADKGRLYVRDITGQVYGWIAEKDKDRWEIYHPPSLDNAFEAYLFERVDRIVQTSNSRLRKLFEFLNQRYKKKKTPPQWIRYQTPALLRYTFASGSADQDFRRSRAYLFQELTDLLHGTAYKLSTNETDFIISKAS